VLSVRAEAGETRRRRRHRFRLFVGGNSLVSQRAQRNLRAICDAALRGEYELEVVDVVQRPEVAGREMIIATPTLVRVQPRPQVRIVGDMSDRRAILSALALGDQGDG